MGCSGELTEDRDSRRKAKALQKQHQSTQTNRLAVCQSIVDQLAEWTAAIDPVNKDFKITTDVFGFGKLARCHHRFRGISKAFYLDWGVKPVWLHPTIKESDRCITNVLADGAKGIAVVPVSKKDPWFWAMGECVIDWVDIPVESPLFLNKKGTIVTTDRPYRICLFDAYRQEPSDTHTHTDSNPPASTLLVDASHSPPEPDIPMPAFEESLPDLSSDTDSEQESERGLNRRHRRLLRMVRKRRSESVPTSEDEAPPGPGQSSGSEADQHSCHHGKCSRTQGFQEKMRGSTYVHTDTASRKYCPYLQECCNQDSAVNTQEVQQAFSCISSLLDSNPSIAQEVRVQKHCCSADDNFCYRCMAVSRIQRCQVPRDSEEAAYAQVRTTEVVKEHTMQLQVQQVQKAVLQLQIQAGLNHSPRDQSGRLRFSRNVRSVIQADEQWPGTEVYRDRLLERFDKSFFQTKHSASSTAKAEAIRGDNAKVKLELIHNAEPKAQKPIPSVGLRETMMAEKLKDFQEKYFLRECTGNPQWIARAFLVPRAGNNKWQLVIDYCWLNCQLKGKYFPLPVIEDQLANLHGNSLFTLLHLEDGLHQMHLGEDNRHLTAFYTPFGVAEWNVLQMAVKVGPAAYQEMVQHVVQHGPAARLYIDKILAATGRESLKGAKSIHDKQSPEFIHEYYEKHFRDVLMPFEALEEAELTVKPKECQFFRQTVKYVGHILKGGKRFPDPSKVESIKEWDHRTITTPKRDEGFSGLAGWYHVYIKDFAKSTRPLMESLQGKYKYQAKPTDGTVELGATGFPKKRKRLKLPAKDMKIDSTKKMIDGFEKLTQSFIDMVNDKSKHLCLPQPDGKWLIQCDASNFAVGGAREQLQPDGTYRPVYLHSRKLQGGRSGTTKDGFTPTKHTGQYRWTPREKETYAIGSCLLKFQIWIGGQEIMVQTDHSAIVKWHKEDLCTISGLLGRGRRWHELLSRFSLMIEYTPGPENHVGDALSRWADPAGTAQDTNFHGSDQDLVG